MDKTSIDHDATLVRRIAEDQDESALTELMKRHAPKVTGDLRRRFRHQLQHTDIDEAVNRAALNVWKNAHRFDSDRPFGPWFLMIAQHAALDILKGEKRKPSCELVFDPPNAVPDRLDDELARSPRTTWRVAQMESIIEHELRGFEQVVARADLAAGGSADTQLLMKQHDKSKNVVQVTRSKVWKKIRMWILDREAPLDHSKVSE